MPLRSNLLRSNFVTLLSYPLVIGLLLAGSIILTPGDVAARDSKTPPNFAAFKPETGAAGVFVFNVIIREADQNRNLALRVGYPDATGTFPLVILSPGLGSQAGDCAAIADHWVSHGYVVITITHNDAGVANFATAKIDDPAVEHIIQNRIADVAYVISHLDAVADQMYGLKSHIDPGKLVVAGNGLGALPALAAGGVELRNKADGSMLAMDDVHASAVMLLGYPGGNPALPSEPWTRLTKAALISIVDVATKDQTKEEHGKKDRSKKARGNKDQADKSADIKTPDGEKASSAYEVVAGADVPETLRSYLTISKADSNFGGLIGKEGKDEPDFEGFAIMKGVSTAFLDATTKDDSVAKEFVTKTDISSLTGNRAKLSSKPPVEATAPSRKN